MSLAWPCGFRQASRRGGGNAPYPNPPRWGSSPCGGRSLRRFSAVARQPSAHVLGDRDELREFVELARFLDEVARDDETLHLIRAFVDLRDLRVAHELLDRV